MGKCLQSLASSLTHSLEEWDSCMWHRVVRKIYTYHVKAAVAPVRKPPRRSGGSWWSTIHGLSGASGEPRLPFGWLWVFVALMEIKETQNNNKTKRRNKKGRGKNREETVEEIPNYICGAKWVLWLPAQSVFSGSVCVFLHKHGNGDRGRQQSANSACSHSVKSPQLKTSQKPEMTQYLELWGCL